MRESPEVATDKNMDLPRFTLGMEQTNFPYAHTLEETEAAIALRLTVGDHYFEDLVIELHEGRLCLTGIPTLRAERGLLVREAPVEKQFQLSALVDGKKIEVFYRNGQLHIEAPKLPPSNSGPFLEAPSIYFRPGQIYRD